MKASELSIVRDGAPFSCKTIKAGARYRFSVYVGHCLPSTKPQALMFIKESRLLSYLNADDVDMLEPFLNKHGFSGNYKPTLSGRWARLLNHSDLWVALSKEFGIKIKPNGK